MSATMTQTMTPQELQVLHVHKEIEIDAPIDVVWSAMLEQLGPASDMPDGQAFPMKLEAWPGGRWYRDLGNNTGHLWGHVQVIKPPKLLEINGPLFMSYAAISHVQYRLSESGSGTRLAVTHRAMGEIPADHREGVGQGWDHDLKRIKERAEK
jgi:hypothetical protein